jgi:hypothetical protein
LLGPDPSEEELVAVLARLRLRRLAVGRTVKPAWLRTMIGGKERHRPAA